MSQITLGQAVPDFEAPSTGEKTVKLANFRGKTVILYFYPRDNTPGCTQEGQSFRDNIEQISAFNAIVLGVSRDSVRTHEGFKCKQQFPFDLLADQDGQLCQLFDVIKMKNMYGKEARGIERSTFIIDPQGVLVREWRKVKVKDHCQEVLKALAELSASH